MADPYGNDKNGISDPAGPTGLPSKNSRGRPKSSSRTIASLNLDLEAAQSGRLHFLLPPEHRGIDGGKTYPLPDTLEDLLALSVLHVPLGAQSGPAAYVRRARAKHKARISAKNPARLDEAADRASTVLRDIRDTREEAKKELAGIREDTVRAAATLTDLYGLIRAGSRMILEGFVQGTKVNGQEVKIDEFNQTQGKILGHIAKLGGINEDDKAEAESAVFEQAAENTRRRLAENEALAQKNGPEKVTH